MIQELALATNKLSMYHKFLQCTVPGQPIPNGRNGARGPAVPIMPGRMQDREYECGKKLEAHFHHYRSNNQIGHFKIGRVEYGIPDRNVATNAEMKRACCEARAALAANHAGMFQFCYTCMGQIWKQNICNGFSAVCKREAARG